MIRSGQNAARRIVLVTGFGGFPGSPRNPTQTIVAQLQRHRGRLDRLGLDLRCVVLPVRYAELQGRLATLAEEHRPDVVLHLGVAGRHRRISVEMQAVNRAGPLHPDAGGRCPAQVLLPFRQPVLRATYPGARILAALRTAGVQAEISRDAGDYACNATLYRSLAMRLAPEVGFVHVPRARQPSTRCGRRVPPRPAQADLTRAVLIAVLALARPPAG